MKSSIKKFFPHVLAVVFFLTLTMAYLSPILKGKELKKHDYTVFLSSAQEAQDFKKETGETTYWTNSMFAGMPIYLTVPIRDKVFGKIHKIIKIWKNENMSHLFLYLLGFYIALLAFGIRPWLAVAGAVAFAFSSYFFIIMQAGHSTKAFAIGYMPPILAGVYLAFNKKHLTGALLMALFLALQIRVNHFQITYYTGLMVLIFGFIYFIKAIKEKALASYGKSFGLCLIGATLALGVNITSIYTTYEYGQESIRGPSELSHGQENKTSGLDKDYATQWSYGIGETFTLLVPNFKGGASGGALSEDSETYKLFAQAQGKAQAKKVIQRLPLYFGTQPGTSGPVYAGAIVCFLFVLGIFVLRGPVRSWLIAATIISIVLSWGRNFMTGDLFKYGLLITGVLIALKAYTTKSDKKKQLYLYITGAASAIIGFIIATMLPESVYNNPFSYYVLDYFPGYNKFRTVSMTLIIAEFTMPLMGILAIAKVLSDKFDKREFTSALYWSAGITGGLSLIIWLVSSSFSYVAPGDASMQDVLVQALQADRESMLKADALRSFVFIILGAALLWATFNNKLQKKYFYPLLIVLFLVDMWPINKRYLNDSHFVSKRKFKEQFNSTPADKFILEDDDKDFRVLNLSVDTFNDATTSHYHKSIGGYHGAKMRRYQELINHHIMPEIQNIARTLNSKVEQDEVFKAVASNKVLNMLNTKYLILNPESYPLVNYGALGHAWFVQQIDVVDNADQEINALSTFDPKTDLVVDKRFESMVSSLTPVFDSTATISLEVYKPNYLKYTSNANSEQLAVFSEIYYPHGWHVTIDGEPVEYFRANYVLRAMRIPEGAHEIEFSFKPRSVAVCNSISIFSAITLLLLALGVLFKLSRNNKEE